MPAFLRLALTVLALAALPIAARAIDLGDVRLPDDVAVAAEPAGFLGPWIGSWGGSLHHVLVVERVDGDGTATLVYATGREDALRLDPATTRRTGRVENGVLTVPGAATATYRLDADGTLEGLYVHDAVRAHARMRPLRPEALAPGAPPLFWDEPDRITLPGPPEGGAPSRLETFVFRPDGPGPFPLLVVHHGSTGFGMEPAAFARPWWNFGLADAFRRRGWIVAFPQRRGRGGSSGLYDEGFSADRREGYACEAELALAGAERALTDVAAATDALRGRPEVAAGRILVAGESRGGALAVADAGRHPDRVAGVINVVGGWVGAGCEDADVINRRLFREGAAFPRPMLWLYGEGDAYYPLGHSLANFEAFREAGGRGRFLELPVPGEQRGHAALSYPELWEAPVDAYLAETGLAGSVDRVR